MGVNINKAHPINYLVRVSASKIILIRSSSHGSTSEMAAAVRYRDPELRPGYSYSDLHSDYHPEEDPEYYCE